MHLLDSYKHILNVETDKPYLNAHYFALEFDKYITIQVGSAMPAKTYSYFQEVVDFIYPDLEKLGIKIVQLGLENEYALNKCVNLLGKTTINHMNYVVSNAMLHVGVDSSLVHVANGYGKNIVALYGISPPDVCGPYFNEGGKLLLCPNFPEGSSYSYNPQEFPRMVDTIKPEAILQCLQSQLEINTKLPESLYFGPRFKNSILEITPDVVLSANFLAGNELNIRLDYFQDRNIEIDFSKVYQNVAARNSVVVTTQPISLDILKREEIKKHLKVFYIINNDDDMEFVKELKNNGIRFVLIVRDEDSKLNDLKLKYCDLTHVQYLVRDQKIDFEIGENTHYKTNKIILSGGKVYTSNAALFEDKPVESLENLSQPLNIIENKVLLQKELEFFYIYNI